MPRPPKQVDKLYPDGAQPPSLFRWPSGAYKAVFDNEDALNNWLVSRLKRAPLAIRTAFEETFNMKTHSIVFTHGDFNLSNIMVNVEAVAWLYLIGVMLDGFPSGLNVLGPLHLTSGKLTLQIMLARYLKSRTRANW